VIGGAYHDITDARLWESYDLGGDDPTLRGYVGAAFDGAFLYLSPWQNGSTPHGKVARFETAKPFAAKDSWASYDVGALNPNAKAFAGSAVFTNPDTKVSEFLYLVPHGPTGAGDTVARYRLGQPFDAPGSWDFIALGTHPPADEAAGFGGAVLNYSHVWLPTRDPNRPFALHENRSDPKVSTNPQRKLDAGWESFNVRAGVDAGTGTSTGGYYGGAFDGKETLYFAPYTNGTGPHGVALSKKVGGGTPNGWTTFDLTTLDNRFRGYAGAVLADGFIYYVPHVNAADRHGHVVRVNTTTGFTDPKSWSAMDLTTVNPNLKGFVGGVFDGRFVYFVPFFEAEGLFVTRYDTKAPFTDGASWSTFDVKKLPGGASRFNGGAFDGQYVYFVPYDKGPVVRFNARVTKDPTVKTANGSFL
jgi:hypothetical protein